MNNHICYEITDSKSFSNLFHPLENFPSFNGSFFKVES
jgi:hypothetical protein